MARDISRRRARREAERIKRLPWRQIVNPYTPIEVLSADQVEAIHHASLRVLEELGMAAALRQKQEGPRQRLATFEVGADDADAFGSEAIFRDGERVGYVTSGGYGHCVSRSIALGYLNADAVLSDGAYFVEILGEKRPATFARQPLFDPDGRRMRG